MEKRIKSTVNPDRRYSYNEWMSKVMDAKENIEHLQSSVVRDRAKKRWDDRNKRYWFGV